MLINQFKPSKTTSMYIIESQSLVITNELIQAFSHAKFTVEHFGTNHIAVSRLSVLEQPSYGFLLKALIGSEYIFYTTPNPVIISEIFNDDYRSKKCKQIKLLSKSDRDFVIKLVLQTGSRILRTVPNHPEKKRKYGCKSNADLRLIEFRKAGIKQIYSKNYKLDGHVKSAQSPQTPMLSFYLKLQTQRVGYISQLPIFQ